MTTQIVYEVPDGAPRPEDVRALLGLLERQIDATEDKYGKGVIREQLFPLVSAYAKSLASGEAESVALVQLQSDEIAAKKKSDQMALERFKIRSIHWTIRFCVAMGCVALWLVFA